MEVSDSLWIVLKANLNLLFSTFTTFFGVILGGGHQIFKFLFNSVRSQNSSTLKISNNSTSDYLFHNTLLFASVEQGQIRSNRHEHQLCLGNANSRRSRGFNFKCLSRHDETVAFSRTFHLANSHGVWSSCRISSSYSGGDSCCRTIFRVLLVQCSRLSRFMALSRPILPRLDSVSHSFRRSIQFQPSRSFRDQRWWPSVLNSEWFKLSL
jgi:hypothetical protein